MALPCAASAGCRSRRCATCGGPCNAQHTSLFTPPARRLLATRCPGRRHRLGRHHVAMGGLEGPAPAAVPRPGRPALLAVAPWPQGAQGAQGHCRYRLQAVVDPCPGAVPALGAALHCAGRRLFAVFFAGHRGRYANVHGGRPGGHPLPGRPPFAAGKHPAAARGAQRIRTQLRPRTDCLDAQQRHRQVQQRPGPARRRPAGP
ncbi:hypothetical protein D9M71_517530 [compost metagenome]